MSLKQNSPLESSLVHSCQSIQDGGNDQDAAVGCQLKNRYFIHRKQRKEHFEIYNKERCDEILSQQHIMFCCCFEQNRKQSGMKSLRQRQRMTVGTRVKLMRKGDNIGGCNDRKIVRTMNCSYFACT